jgi:hypothetical protein
MRRIVFSSVPPSTVTASAVLFLFNVIETIFLHARSTSEFSHSLGQTRTSTRPNRMSALPPPQIRFGAPREFPAYKRVGRYSIRASRFLMDDRCQLLPRAGRTPRASSALAISLKVAAPAFWIAWIRGISFVANSSATCAWAMRPSDPATERFRVAELCPASTLCLQRRRCSL